MRKRLLLSAFALTACTVHAPTVDETARIVPRDGSGGFTLSSSGVTASSSASSASSMSKVSRAVRRVHITASGGSFVPSLVEADARERVQLLVHGETPFVFLIPGMRIREQVIPGSSTAVDLPTNLPGTYEFRCAESCGEAPGNGIGIIVVKGPVKR